MQDQMLIFSIRLILEFDKTDMTETTLSEKIDGLDFIWNFFFLFLAYIVKGLTKL